jgi:starch synthase
MVTSEALPFAKTGGLADVLGALPAALVGLGHAVDVVLPLYRGIQPDRVLSELEIVDGLQTRRVPFHASIHEGVQYVFVDWPAYFERDYLYGAVGHDYPDNPERFTLLARAALAWAFSNPQPYQVAHVHDWQAGLVPLLLSRMYRTREAPYRLPCVMTIHNLAYQGIFDASWLPRLSLPWELMRPEVMEYWGRISFLKAGIVFSRTITTVSPRYAQEIQTPELGFGFDGILRQRAADLVGILNGIDYDQWDPERDPNLPVPFSASKLEGKGAAKRRVLETYELNVAPELLRRPLIGMISRLVDQKGFDLMARLAEELPRLDATFVLLGTGERRYEDLWLAMQARHPDRIAVKIGFDERLAHLIEGGADLFLMPSRFEPCGLNQMYSLRYGTLPLVRATGGLADTVENYDPATGRGSGFTFDEYSPQALLGTLRWALGVYQDRAAWRRLQVAGMKRDHSWAASAREYEKVYERTAVSPVWT